MLTTTKKTISRKGIRLWFFLPLLLLTTWLGAQEFVVRDGFDFCHRGEKFRFIGVNTPKLHWNAQGNNASWSEQDVINVITAANNMGAKVFRIFLARNVANYNATVAVEDINRLIGYLNMVNSDLKLIVAFTDVHGDQSMFLPGDAGFFNGNKLNNDWFVYGYKQNYLPFVKGVITALKNDPHIFAWELGNELQNVGHGQNVINFARTVGGMIKTNVNQMLTTGFSNLQNATENPDNFDAVYGDNSPFDFVTIHGYNKEWNNNSPFNFQDREINNALAYGMPYIVEELGFTGGYAPGDCNFENDAPHPWRGYTIPDCNNTRNAAHSVMVNALFDDLACKGVMPWAFMPYEDMGYGDACRGMSPVGHPDFNALYQVYDAKATALHNQVLFCNSSINCPSTRNLSGALHDLHIYHASNYITSYNDVKSSAIVRLNAGNQIRMRPGFKVRSGAIFRASVEGCPNPSSSLGAEAPLSFSENREMESSSDRSVAPISVFPNPFSDEITIRTPFEEGTLRLYDWTGKCIWEDIIDGHQQRLNLKAWSAGMYVLEVKNRERQHTLKIVKH